MGTSITMSRVLAILLGCLLVATVTNAMREKPADWDDEVDGAWEPPKEDEIDAGDTGAFSDYTPPPPPEQEQYLSQEPDAWVNTFVTTRLWEVINKDDMEGLDEMIKANPRVVHARAEDGRGPLFWAYEYGRAEMVTKMEDMGVDNTVRDKNGVSPPEMASEQEL